MPTMVNSYNSISGKDTHLSMYMQNIYYAYIERKYFIQSWNFVNAPYIPLPIPVHGVHPDTLWQHEIFIISCITSDKHVLMGAVSLWTGYVSQGHVSHHDSTTDRMCYKVQGLP